MNIVRMMWKKIISPLFLWIVCFCSLLFSLSSLSVSAFTISEVSFDGRSERIEITNSSFSSFSGTLTLWWAKSSDISISLTWFDIWDILVLWDAISTLSGYAASETYHILDNQWLSLKDTTWFEITLSLSWLVVDSFVADELLVSDTNDTDLTLHRVDSKIFSWVASPRWSYTIPEESPLVLSWAAIASWSVWVEIEVDVDVDVNIEAELETDEIQEIPPYEHTFWTESDIWVENDDEYTYICDILISPESWAQRLSVDDASCDTSLLYLRQEIKSIPWSSSWTEELGRWCSYPSLISDDATLDIILEVSNPRIWPDVLCTDQLSLSPESSQVADENIEATEAIEAIEAIEATEAIEAIGQQEIEVPIESVDPQQTTNISPLSTLSWLVRIESIFPYETDELWEYIHLQVLEAYSWSLSLAWAGHWSATKDVSVTANAWDHIIVTDDVPKRTAVLDEIDEWFILASLPAIVSRASLDRSRIHVVALSSLSLTDSGEVLSIYRHDGQEMDSVVYSSWKSPYIHVFEWVASEYVNFDTPRSFVSSHLSSTTTSIDSQGDVQGDVRENSTQTVFSEFENEVLLDEWPTLLHEEEDDTTGDDDHVAPTYTWETETYEIVAVLPNPDGADTWIEWVRLRYIWSWALDISAKPLYINAWRRQRQIQLSPDHQQTLLTHWASIEIVGDFWLYNDASCIRLEDGVWTLYDEVCYPKSSSGVWYTSEISSTSRPSSIDIPEREQDMFDWSPTDATIYMWAIPDTSPDTIYTPPQSLPDILRIDALLPNPDGADTDAEWVRLTNLSTEQIDITDLVIDAGKRQTWVASLFDDAIDTVWLLPSQSTELLWTRWLYNSASCVRLTDLVGNIYDERCYPKPKNDQRYSAGVVYSEALSWDVYSSVDLSDDFDGSPLDDSIYMWALQTDPPLLEEQADTYDLFDTPPPAQFSIHIDALLPNPDWADTDHEWIRLTNTWETPLDVRTLVLNAWKRSAALADLSTDIIAPGETSEYIWTLWLYNSESCVRLEHVSWYVYDTRCYTTPKAWVRYSQYAPVDNAWEEKQRKHVERSDIYETFTWAYLIWAHMFWSVAVAEVSAPSYMTGVLVLDAVLPNPDWADTGAEWLRLRYIWTWAIDLWDVRIHTGKRTIALTWWVLWTWVWDITKELKKELIGSRGLYNRPACVRLEHRDGTIYDQLCYPKPKDAIRYTRLWIDWVDWVADIWTWASDIFDLSDLLASLSLDIDQDDDSACVSLGDSSPPVMCTPIAWLSKMRKNVSKLEQKIAKEKDENEQTVQKRTAKHALMKNENALHKEFIYESMWFLREDRWPVFYDTSLIDNYSTRKQLMGEIKESSDQIDFAGVQFFDNEVTTVYKLHGDALPLADVEVQEIYGELFEETSEFLEDLWDRLSVSKKPSLAMRDDSEG